MMSLPTWLPGPMFLPGGLCPWSMFLLGGSVLEGVSLPIRKAGISHLVWEFSFSLSTSSYRLHE